MRSAARSSRRWHRHRLPALLGFALLIQSGVWIAPNYAMQAAVGRNYPTNPFPGRISEYLTGSLAVPLLSRLLHMTSSSRFVVLGFGVTAAGFVSVYTAMRKRLAPLAAVLVIAVNPITTICLQWVGLPDIATLALCAWCLVGRRWWVPFLTCALLPVVHREQALLLLPAIVVARTMLLAPVPRFETETGPSNQPLSTRRTICAILVGSAVGHLLMTLLMAQWTPRPGTGRLTFALRFGRAAAISNVGRYPFVSLASMLGAGWIIVIAFALQTVKSGGSPRNRTMIALGGSLLYAFLVALPTLDFTRVSAIVFFPAYVACAIGVFPTGDGIGVLDAASTRALDAGWRRALLIGAVLCPRLVVFDGLVVPWTTPYTVAFAGRALTGRLRAWQSSYQGNWAEAPFARHGPTPLPDPVDAPPDGER
jgi:hypothetical protein